mmetsp:Transcript_45944/g.132501  ORF Transcript_45944/g.132501 Transcript_45944/m.132501 type:complete len:374 (+) Transcript_45944:715-1836(+)
MECFAGERHILFDSAQGRPTGDEDDNRGPADEEAEEAQPADPLPCVRPHGVDHQVVVDHVCRVRRRADDELGLVSTEVFLQREALPKHRVEGHETRRGADLGVPLDDGVLDLESLDGHLLLLGLRGLGQGVDLLLVVVRWRTSPATAACEGQSLAEVLIVLPCRPQGVRLPNDVGVLDDLRIPDEEPILAGEVVPQGRVGPQRLWNVLHHDGRRLWMRDRVQPAEAPLQEYAVRPEHTEAHRNHDKPHEGGVQPVERALVRNAADVEPAQVVRRVLLGQEVQGAERAEDRPAYGHEDPEIQAVELDQRPAVEAGGLHLVVRRRGPNRRQPRPSPQKALHGRSFPRIDRRLPIPYRGEANADEERGATADKQRA